MNLLGRYLGNREQFYKDVRSKTVRSKNYYWILTVIFTLLTDKLGRKPKNVLGFITNVIGAVFCVWLGIRGWTTMIGMVAVNVRTVSLGIPYWLTYLPIALSLFGMGIRFALLAYCNVMRLANSDWEIELMDPEGGED